MFITKQAFVVKIRLFKLRNSKKCQATTIRKTFFSSFFTCRESLVIKMTVGGPVYMVVNSHNAKVCHVSDDSDGLLGKKLFDLSCV